MQTDSISGRATPRAAPMAAQSLSPTRQQGSEKFDSFVEKARNEDPAGKNIRHDQASDEAAGITLRSQSRGDAGERGVRLHAAKDLPDPITGKDISFSVPAQIDKLTSPANSTQEGEAETELPPGRAGPAQSEIAGPASSVREGEAEIKMPPARADPAQSEIASPASSVQEGEAETELPPGRAGPAQSEIAGPASSVREGEAEAEMPPDRAGLAQSETVQAGQRPSEHQSEIYDTVFSAQGTGNGDENPAVPAGVVGAQGTDTLGALGMGQPLGEARGSDTLLSASRAQTDRQNPEFAGFTPSAISGGSSLRSETGAIGSRGSGVSDTLSRYHQAGASPPLALPTANSPKATPDSQVSMYGQLPAAPSVSLPQPPAALNAALATVNGMMRAGESGITIPVGMIPASDSGPIFSDSEVPELSFAGLVESTLQGGPGRPAEYNTGSPQAARLVAGQLADALITQQGNKVEISLSPAELGRVRMVLSTTDAGVLVSITAERPETLDMMRRHIDQLADEFRKLGYAGIDFEFSGGNGEGGFDKESTVTHPDDETGYDNFRGAPASDPEPSIRAYVSRGLDLRL